VTLRAALLASLFVLPLACSSADDAPPLDPGAPADGGADGGGASTPCAATDIEGRLACIPGLTFEEITGVTDAGKPLVPEGYRRFVLTYDQPVDHAHPEGARFKQRLGLLHRGFASPMLLASSGYGLSSRQEEIMLAFTTNQLQVEHRFFAPSIPEVPAWETLTIAQSAADYHRIVTAFKSIYAGHWVNTGHSKGGMTSIYHHRFYPDDIDGTVAYVAPNSLGETDARYPAFIDRVGGDAYAACRAKVVELQKTVLKRRSEILPKMVPEGVTYARLGGEAIAIEHAVLEMPFTFWQYNDPESPDTGCAKIPASDAPIDELFDYFAQIASIGNYSDYGFDYFAPFYYQSATQLGAPGVNDAPLAGLLQHRETYNVEAYAPPGVPTHFDPNAMIDIQKWLSTEGAHVVLIYGELDPWSAGAFDLGAAKDAFRYYAPKANHSASIAALAPADRDAVKATLQRWLGAPLTNQRVIRGESPAARAPGDEDAPLARPRL
jgi:hypothetical protein